jgi:hypothetical protein
MKQTNGFVENRFGESAINRIVPMMWSHAHNAHNAHRIAYIYMASEPT